jgi:hypothetical protein
MADPLERALNRLWSETPYPEAKWAVLRPGDRRHPMIPPAGQPEARWVYTDKDVRVDQSGVLYLESEERDSGTGLERFVNHIYLPPGTWLGAVRL